jgi:glycosyltransferase involved in cell wall biosynthesis
VLDGRGFEARSARVTFEKDFVILYAPPWSGPTRFSKHHIARHLAEHSGRVLYVEAPLTPLALRRGRAFLGELAETFRAPRAVADRLWVRRAFLPIPYHAATGLTSRRAANRLGQRLLAPVVRRDLERLHFSKPVLIAGLPHAVDVAPLLPHQALVYHCADDYAHVDGFPDTLPLLEAELCRQADLVITTSETLCMERQRFNPNTHWVPNGADIAHFSEPASPAPEVERLAKPVVGFVGGLSGWVDTDLLAQLAAARPHWSFVLVGPVSIDVSVIQSRPNVMLLGPRPYEVLPKYLAAMGVGLIPFKHNAVTYHADPIKAYEYLAAGLPVVATDLPALRRLEHVVRLADSPQAFLRQLDAALAEGREPGRTERQAEAARHSWASRFQTIDALMNQSLACAS